ncbi:putative ABC transporter permease protein [Fundidesulfovibrio magnetotacticus]|uniref:Putative ABC transporter permease protein n=1 Tax=Fundidesulfovibrio magnetotacticus TaxID=2730080 RepID=A0A6V8M2S1_9BACT|nr:iron ABC transporter permease [Fundidesulfovibrio magnetotacticus]GFK94735.1 putative ABC transporter permease protein [Fundidesulfovibrio magnetotacticus]
MSRTALILLAALASLVLLAAGAGAVDVPAWDAARILAARLAGRPEWLEGVPEVSRALVWEVRLPRILTALAVGGSLALSGALFQGVLRNPLADSYTLGVSAGGALGGCLCLLLGFTAFGPLSVPAWALAGSALALAVVLAMARAGGGFDSLTLVLAGVMAAATLQACIGFVKFAAGENVAGLVFWLLGGLSSRTWAEAGVAWAGLCAGLPAALWLARDLDALCLGDEQARALGVDASRVRLALLCAAGALTACSVAVSGIVGFVGLMAPHTVRLAVGPGHARLLPLSTLAGMLLVLGADTASRTLLPHEAPVGVITALLGGPYFFFLFVRGRGRA